MNGYIKHNVLLCNGFRVISLPLLRVQGLERGTYKFYNLVLADSLLGLFVLLNNVCIIQFNNR